MGTVCLISVFHSCRLSTTDWFPCFSVLFKGLKYQIIGGVEDVATIPGDAALLKIQFLSEKFGNLFFFCLFKSIKVTPSETEKIVITERNSTRSRFGYVSEEFPDWKVGKAHNGLLKQAIFDLTYWSSSTVIITFFQLKDPIVYLTSDYCCQFIIIITDCCCSRWGMVNY